MIGMVDNEEPLMVEYWQYAYFSYLVLWYEIGGKNDG